MPRKSAKRSADREPVTLRPAATAMALAVTLALGSVALTPNAAATEGSTVPGASNYDLHNARADMGGAVYVMTNDPDANEILVFARERDGELRAMPNATVSTGGSGGGDNAPVDPLGSQNSLVYSDHLNMLFAVNAGDNTIAAFDTSGPGLKPRLVALVSSGGYLPVSVAVNEDLLYVLNAGGTGTVTTFAVGPDGQLSEVGSLDLGLANGTSIPFNNIFAPGQVGVDRLARRLVVVNAGGQEVLVSDLDDDGIPTGALVSTPTTGIAPFAFAKTPYGSILVAEAGSGSVSAFDPPVSGMPMTPTANSVSTTQAASCWIVSNANGFAYVANTGSDTISQYGYTRTGGLELINAAAAMAAGAPTDMTLANHGAFLYSLDAGAGAISGFAVDPENGELSPVETEGGLPAAAGLQGIAARDF